MGGESEYGEKVWEMIISDDNVIQLVSHQVIDIVGISIDQFELTRERLQSDPAFAEQIRIALQLKEQKIINEPTLSKARVMQYWEK